MVKVKHAASSRKRRKRALKRAKGHFGSRSRLYRIATESGKKAMISSYIDRKKKKRVFRSLWVSRISAACEADGISYSKFIAGLKKARIDINRKMLAEIAVKDAKGFKSLVNKVK